MLAVLRRAARTGQGAVVVVSGEAGIGKTSLLRTVADRSQRAGFVAGLSQAEENGQIAPMAPLLVALRSGPDPILSQEEFGDLAPLYDRQLWLVDRLADILAKRAADDPVLVAIDDLHWADRFSVFALRVLPGRLASSPVVWLLATRPERNGPVDEVTAALPRGMPAATIDLGPLDGGSIRALVADRLGSPPAGELRDLLDGSAGNPFLAAELAEGLALGDARGGPVSSGSELPGRLVIGVRSRLSSLPDQTLRLVQVGAVLGREFTAECAAAVIGRPTADVVLPWLEPAMRQGVLADYGDKIVFRHDLLRRAVYADVPAPVRRSRHAAAAAHLLAAGGSPADAAPHVLASATPGDRQAAEVLRRAARDLAATMPATAAGLISRAVELLEPGSDLWASAAEEGITILAGAHRGRDAVDLADRLLATDPDPVGAARIQLLAIGPLADLGRLAELGERAEATLAAEAAPSRALTGEGIPGGTLAAAEFSGGLRAGLQAATALSRSRGRDVAAVRRIATAALARARQAGHREAQAVALRALGEAARTEGRHDAALDHFRELRTIAGATRISDEVISLQLLDQFDAAARLLPPTPPSGGVQPRELPDRALAFARVLQAYGRGRLAEADAAMTALVQLSPPAGTPGQEPKALAPGQGTVGQGQSAVGQDPHGVGQDPPGLGEGPRGAGQGRRGVGQERRGAGRGPQGYGFDVEAAVLRSRLACLRGDLPGARDQLAAAGGVLAAGDSAGSLLLACGRAWLAESQGDYADAAALAAQAGLSAGTVPQAWCWQPGWLVAVAHVGGRGGAPDLLSQAAALADAAAARNPQIPTITGVAAQIGGLLTGDVAALARAVEILAASPRPLVRAAAFEDFGRGLLAANQRDRAVPALDSAWDSYAAVGAVGEAQRVRRLLQGAGVRRRRWTRAPARPVRGWAALTATEQRVARLIADGHTNRSAAAELVLSPNTVASHLRSIFGKLGVSSRVQLTRSMLDQGRSPRLTGSLEDFGCPVAQSPPG